ncbi:hypothetical protein VTK56DRAFT_7924 [Thermocarpiscus australiensis]
MRALRYLALLVSSAFPLASGQTDDNVCRVEDRTFSSEAMPPGTYQPYDKLNPVVGGATSQFYINVVNLTPHRLVLEHTHSYQMDIFNFGDVPQGRARQNAVKYRATLYSGDDAGEAYYRIDGTDKQFVLRVRSYIPSTTPRRVMLDLSGMGLGQREYVYPGGESAVSLVIAGSDWYGFRASLRHGAGNWMRQLYGTLRDRPIRHIILPGTHNSGMSKITNKISSIGTAPNTQNQGINIYDQLRAGARWFDLRIGSVHPNDNANRHNGFWVLHVNDEMTMGLAVGNTGESLDEVISEINRFTLENPGEVIFFAIRYLVGRYELPDRGPILWNTAMVNEFFVKLRGINYRCGNLDTSTGFQNHKTSYLLDQNDGMGCVVLLLDGQNLQGDVPHESVADGIYDMGRMGIRDHWSNKKLASDMAPDQVNVWRSATRGGPDDYGNLLISQWLVTPDALAATAWSLQNFATQQANPSLYWAGVNGMDPQHWPNVLLVDYLGVQYRDRAAWDQLSAELYTLALGLNLYVVSENCDVSRRRSPLLRPPAARVKVGNLLDVAPWNGIIFANGTTVDYPAAALHPGRMEVLHNGTVLSNGTVLETSIPNPWL